jgi:hypothetical protein
MTSSNAENQIGKKKRYFILGILTLCFLMGGLMIWLQITSHSPASGSSASSTLQINIPDTQYPTIPPSAPDFTVSIHSIDDSQIIGSVTFKDIAGTVAILLVVDGPSEEEESEESIMPVELHYGTCAAPGPLAYPMTAPDAGASETDLSINLKQFNMQKPMAVIFYRSIQDHTAIACGDVQ